MKHRSVIAFVIVAAALFSLPQLSHDLRALKGAVGTALHRELLHAFLNLPAGEPSAAAPAVRTAQPLLASCSQQVKAGTTWSKAGRAGAPARAASRSFEQSAMIGDPTRDPVNEKTKDEVTEVAGILIAPQPEVETEVAMITPPNNGVEPPRVAATLAAIGGARIEANMLRVEADGLRVASATSARFEVNGPEWQKALEEATRNFNGPARGTFEFRLVRDGVKARVLKFKCSECPATAPRVTRLPRQVAVNIELPEPDAHVGIFGE